MARKKNKHKDVRAGEKRRLDAAAGGNTPNACRPGESDGTNGRKPVRRKDSRGKRIPTEPERRTKGQLDENVGKGPQKKATSPKSNGQKPGTGAKKPERAKRVFWTIASHPFAVTLVIVASVIIGVAVYGIVEQNVQTQPMLSQEDSKSSSLIGLTSPARTVIEDSGKFDMFWEVPGTHGGEADNNGFSYAQMFDRDILPEEQKVLVERGQALGEDGTFAYNPDISSAKTAKEEAAKEQAALDTESNLNADAAKGSS